MIYYCENCHSDFKEPRRENASSEKFGYDEVLSCPNCGSDSISQGVQCADCEKVMPLGVDEYQVLCFKNSYNEEMSGVICNDCLFQLLEEIL